MAAASGCKDIAVQLVEPRLGQGPDVAFGGGRHKCGGNAFAILQLKAIFATLLLDFDFQLANAADEYMDDHTVMTIKPNAPMTVRLKGEKT